jgi:hypothetical protein
VTQRTPWNILAKTVEYLFKLTPILISLTALVLSYQSFVTNKQLAIVQHQAWVRPEGHVTVHSVTENRLLKSDRIECREVSLNIPLTNHGDVLAKNVEVRVCRFSENHCSGNMFDGKIEIAGKQSTSVTRSIAIFPHSEAWKLFSDNDPDRKMLLRMEVSYADDLGTSAALSYDLYISGKEIREVKPTQKRHDL